VDVRGPTEGGSEVIKSTSLRLAGWKSIRDAKIELRPLNVLIGANGAGKSNLVSFFKLMREMMAGRFQGHVGTAVGAESLFLGAEVGVLPPREAGPHLVEGVLHQIRLVNVGQSEKEAAAR
jgi:predicted ATPase